MTESLTEGIAEPPGCHSWRRRSTAGETPRVLQRWQNAPAWVLGVASGGVFAALMFLFSLIQGHQWLPALLGTVAAGVLFGAFMGPYAARARRQAEAAVGGQGPTLLAASRSLRRNGPGPQGEAEREAVARLARHRLQVLEGQRVWGTVAFLAISVVAAWLALTQSPWWWLEVVFFAVVMAATWMYRRRLRRIVAST